MEHGFVIGFTSNDTFLFMCTQSGHVFYTRPKYDETNSTPAIRDDWKLCAKI